MRDIAIIGAGPYGLSLAAHLNKAEADFSIFGVPMQSWRESMPRGMHLKSEGFASTLYDGKGQDSFARYCRDHAIPYADTGTPVSLEHFGDYGVSFQQRHAPDLQAKQAVDLRRVPGGFALRFSDGETASFRRVVLAVGITRFAFTPPVLQALPAQQQSHASEHHDMARFAGKTVAVVGGGSSATDCAAALIEAGATVHILTRKPQLRFHAPPSRHARTLFERLRWPLTTIGTGWRAVFCAHMPLVFHAMPQRFRHTVTRRYLGPVSCWFTRPAIEAGATVHGATEVSGARVENGRATLTLTKNGQPGLLTVDHVIAATGYRVDLDRLGFIDPALRSIIRTADKTPVLSRNFETSLPGLFFVGVASSNAFGPLVRFACGAEFTAGRLSKHLAPARRHRIEAVGADPLASLSPTISEAR